MVTMVTVPPLDLPTFRPAKTAGLILPGLSHVSKSTVPVKNLLHRS